MSADIVLYAVVSIYWPSSFRLLFTVSKIKLDNEIKKDIHINKNIKLDNIIKNNKDEDYSILYEKYIKFDNNLKRWNVNDPKMINEWLWFHDQLASYRILCETCNKKKENKPILEHT